MKLKKVLAAGIAAAMTAGMLAGCGNGGSENASGASTSGGDKMKLTQARSLRRHPAARS
jgi:hypothetical protein